MNQCGRCLGKVPAGASACMHCGTEFSTPAGEWSAGIIGVIFVVFLVIYVLNAWEQL